MKSRFSKEILISLLLFSIILFTIYVLFYDCLPFSEDRVKSIEYQADEKVKETIAEVKQKSTATEEDASKVLKTYNVDKADLTANTGEDYEAGKKNPFAEVSEPVKESVTTEVVEGETSKSNSSNPVENTGTFFESKNSK